MVELDDLLAEIYLQTGFNSEFHSNNEMRYAIRGDKESLRRCYLKRIRCFKPFMASDEDRRRADKTIKELRS
jgi:hypothetical protein